MFDISCKRATANQQAGTHCCAVCVTHKLLYSNIPLYTAVCIIQGYPAMEGKGDFDTYQHLYSTAGRNLCAGAAAKAVAQKKDKQSKAAVRICSNSGVTSVFSSYGLWQASALQLRHVQIEVEKTVQKQTILYLSDLHAGTALRTPYEKIKQLAADSDMVLLGGDLFDEATSVNDMKELCSLLSSFDTKLYYAPGNHEILQRKRGEYEKMLKKAGVHILKDQVVAVNGLQLIGRKDKGENRAALSALMAKCRDKEPVLLLEHRPITVREHTNQIFLQLSGHTHNGQVFPNNILTRIPYPKAYGCFKDPYSLLVSSGAGTWGIPMRVASQNEVLLITLIPKTQ